MGEIVTGLNCLLKRHDHALGPVLLALQTADDLTHTRSIPLGPVHRLGMAHAGPEARVRRPHRVSVVALIERLGLELLDFGRLLES